MKRILFIINSLKAGGAEHMLIDILRAIDYSRYEVSLLCFVKGGVYIQDVPSNVMVRYPYVTGTRASNIFMKFLSIFRLCDAWQRWRINKTVKGEYDAIVSYLEGYPVQVHSVLLERGKKNISFIHTDLIAFPDALGQCKSRDNLVKVYNSMSHLVFVSPTAEEAFNKILPEIKSPKSVLPNFIDADKILQEGDVFNVKKDMFTVVTVGRLVAVKGFEIIPKLAATLKERGREVRFLIIGEGCERDHLESLIAEMEVEDRVMLEGFHKNPYPYIKAADVYISTSISEGMPLSICEAMVFGKAIVASKTAGAQFLLANETGILVDNNAHSYVSEIERLMENDSLRNEIGKRAFKKALGYNKNKYMTSLYSFIG